MVGFELHCSGCDNVYRFRHPSITTFEQFRNISLTCPGCDLDIRVDEEKPLRVPMITVKEYMVNEMKSRGLEVDENKIDFIQF